MKHFAEPNSETVLTDRGDRNQTTDRIRIGSRFFEGEAIGPNGIRALIIITMMICLTVMAIVAAYGIFR